MPDFIEKEFTFEENKEKMFKNRNPYLFGVNSKFDYLYKYADMYLQHLFDKRLRTNVSSVDIGAVVDTEYGSGKIVEKHVEDGINE